MYQWEKEKSTRNKQNPSFSSSLLDEIYRSIDGGDEKFGEFNLRKQKVATVKSNGRGGGGRLKSKNAVEDKEIASFRQACLVEKWMNNEKSRRLPEFDQKSVVDNDPLFFSSGSSSSDSSFGWYSEAEAVKPKPSCFGPLNRVKTSRCDDETKTRALKMYATLKKGKQPFSPGGRLTTFIRTIFTNAHSKERKSKSTTCSSATSFSRSFLNQNHPPPPTTTTTFPWARMEKNPSLNEFMRKYNDVKIDDDDDDMASDSSSDLFELDHLAMFKNDKYCEELPVYETTNMGTNLAIASGLVC